MESKTALKLSGCERSDCKSFINFFFFNIVELC